jgi:copper transporter 1
MADHSHHGMADHGAMDHSSHNAMVIAASTTSAPSHMDHQSSGHQMHSGEPMHMMKMFFHFTFGDVLLFEGWTLDNTSMTFVACLVFFALAVLYEGLKCYREYLLKRNTRSPRLEISVISGESPNHAGGDVRSTLPSGSNRRSSYMKMLSLAHITQSLLHIVQVALSYTLMLAFMTFNGYLCISVLLGAGTGYFLFCWRKLTMVDVTEHCH